VGLPINWLSHLPANSPERAEFEILVRNSTQVLGRLREILLKELDSIESWETNPNLYDNPSWSHKQAHLNGQRAVYLQTLKLLSFMDK
jgi:hypothetical protein